MRISTAMSSAGLTALVLTLLVAVDAHAQGQAPAADQLEEIVVTARKRDEALLDVPVAINAFSEEDIESAGIVRPQDFIAYMEIGRASCRERV